MKQANSLLTLQRWWLLGLLFLIPFSLGYLVEEPFAITPLNVISVGFIGLGILNVLLGNLKLAPIRHKPFLFVLAAFMAAMAYALLFTHPLQNGFGLWTSRLLQPLLVGYFAYQLFEQKVVTIEDCIKVLLWSFIPLLFVSMLQVAEVVPYQDAGRFSGPFQRANTFGRYLAIVLVTSLPWIVFSLKSGKRLYLGLWLVGLFMLLGTLSYGSTLALSLALLVTVLLLPKPFVGIKRLVIGVGIVAVLVVVSVAPSLPKWETTINESRLSRLEFWDIAVHVIRDNFWTGIGIKSWETQYAELVKMYRTSLPMNWVSPQPHNVYLDSFVKAGLPGFFAVTLLLLWPLAEGRALVKSFYDRYSRWWLGLSLAAYGTFLLAFGVVDDPIWSDETTPLMYIFLFALASVVAQRSQKKA